MDNIELEKELLEIINKENFFDMILAAKNFEPFYKSSDFYKKTKMPLNEVIKESKIFYALQLKDLSKQIQNLIDNLNLDNVNNLLDKMGDTFTQENKEIKDSLEVLKDLKD